MKFLRIILTAFYSIFATFGIASIVMGNASPFASIVVLAYIAVAAALNLKGGKFVRWVAYGLSVLFIVLGILSLAMFVSTLFGQEFDRVFLYVFAVFGVLGLSTFISLKKQGKTF